MASVLGADVAGWDATVFLDLAPTRWGAGSPGTWLRPPRPERWPGPKHVRAQGERRCRSAGLSRSSSPPTGSRRGSLGSEL